MKKAKPVKPITPYAGTATAGAGGTATAGYAGTLVIKWWDGDKHRLVIGYTGESGVLPNVAYVVKGGKLERKEVAK